MPKINIKLKKLTWIVSLVLAGAIILFGFFRFGSSNVLDDYIFFAASVAISPSAILNYMDFKWKKDIDEHLPDLFRSIVQAQETGMTLPQAIEEASRRDYGPLTIELKRMAAQISWGMSIEESLLSLMRRVDTVLVQRTMPMIIEANRSGGQVEKVFDPMGKFIQTTLFIDKERRTQSRPYIAIIYLAFFVFLFTLILLFRSFFVDLQDLSMFSTSVTAQSSLEQTFSQMTLIQAFFGGLVAGKMGDGTIKAGLRHSVILMLCGYTALKFFL